jgi:hypothetical protein
MSSARSGRPRGVSVPRSKPPRDKAPGARHESYGELARLFEELIETEARLQQDQRRQHELVAACRGLGASWAVIGEALGISYQTAQKRYGRGQSIDPHAVRNRTETMRHDALEANREAQRSAGRVISDRSGTEDEPAALSVSQQAFRDRSAALATVAKARENLSHVVLSETERQDLRAELARQGEASERRNEADAAKLGSLGASRVDKAEPEPDRTTTPPVPKD